MVTRSLHIDNTVDDYGTPTYVTDHSAITDTDLATYVDLNTPAAPATAEQIHADFEPPPITATSVTLTLVAARLTDNLSRLVWDIFDQDVMDVGGQHRLDDFAIDTPITYTRTFDEAYFAPGGQGETEDTVLPVGLTYPDFLNNLRTNTPPYLRFFANQVGTGTKVIRLYTATLTYEGVGLFPLRRWPPNGNGGSGPTRHWPRSPGRRGSY